MPRTPHTLRGFEAQTLFMIIDTFHAQPLANRFAELLHEVIGGSLMKDVVERNKHNAPHICASHDFCDANEVMSEAFAEIVGHTPELIPGQDTEDSALWNTAWGIAKCNHFNRK